MKRSVHGKNGAGGPAVIRFKARLTRHPDVAKNGSLGSLDVPKAVSARLNGMITLEGTINGHPFRAPLEPNASGGHWLRVNDAMRRGAGAKTGDMVALAVLGPEPEPAVPSDLRIAFAASKRATTLWKDLTRIGRLDYIRWIDAAMTPQTRARRVRRTVEQLAEGKRRPCCVNVYEFMLSRVQQ
ncbi:MAG: DUF1905 domain-containing protein [Candidatus Eremiobacteraeota bacterium]|nr:DUF1905 domain-containing protein [Candidatus Eremiobacteraeota bacterium]MBV8281799.1 DUF1905 domain-containing protein [Candidatus Eremiobacteraeota bacterium]